MFCQISKVRSRLTLSGFAQCVITQCVITQRDTPSVARETQFPEKYGIFAHQRFTRGSQPPTNTAQTHWPKTTPEKHALVIARSD